MSDASSPATAGTVYIVGAGPGDPGLLTCKGAEVLRRADVVFYDELLDRRLLDLTGPHCEHVYVGKRGGRTSVSQEEINTQLSERAQNGQVVVRLKGGDPFVFGRGGEEALHLRQAGVDFEIVPGISAAAGATAYAGIPLTHRGLASAAVLVTGNEDPEAPSGQVDWPALARLDATLVIFMAARTLPELCRVLVTHGRPAATPAAVVEWGTWARQRTVEGTLADLPALAEQTGITSPSLIVVGDVVALRPQLAWRERKALFGRTVLVTRSKEQSAELVAGLEWAGAEVRMLPLLEIAAADNLDPLDAALNNLSRWNWLLFTSANGVRFFFDRLRAHQLDARALAHLRIAAVGSKTAEALGGCGLRADLVPDEQSQQGLATAFNALDMQGAHVLFPTSAIGRTELVDALQARGAHVERVTAYQNRPPANIDTRSALGDRAIDMVVFASPSSVDHLYEALGTDGAQLLLEHAAIACIGPTTAAAVHAHGLQVHVQPEHSSVPALVERICAYYGET